MAFNTFSPFNAWCEDIEWQVAGRDLSYLEAASVGPRMRKRAQLLQLCGQCSLWIWFPTALTFRTAGTRICGNEVPQVSISSHRQSRGSRCLPLTFNFPTSSFPVQGMLSSKKSVFSVVHPCQDSWPISPGFRSLLEIHFLGTPPPPLTKKKQLRIRHGPINPWRWGKLWIH